MGPHDGISVLIRRGTGENSSLLPVRTVSRQPSESQHEALMRNRICHDLGLGLPSLQNYEKSMSVV